MVGETASALASTVTVSLAFTEAPVTPVPAKLMARLLVVPGAAPAQPAAGLIVTVWLVAKLLELKVTVDGLTVSPAAAVTVTVAAALALTVTVAGVAAGVPDVLHRIVVETVPRVNVVACVVPVKIANASRVKKMVEW